MYKNYIENVTKRQLGGRRCRWKTLVRVNSKVIGRDNEGWIHLAHDGGQ
jgi:hypothetical protein